jgi:hypothetical protein
METLSVTPTGYAKVEETKAYEIQQDLGNGYWIPFLRDLTHNEARSLRNSLSGPEYRVVHIEVLDW